MKKTIRIFLIATALLMPTAMKADPHNEGTAINIHLMCQKIDPTTNNEGNHRTPPQIPMVYLNSSNGTLSFENPCYESTIELVVPGTESVVFSYVIPDGTDTVQLPTYLSGEYELHIHRGNFCFWGVVEL